MNLTEIFRGLRVLWMLAAAGLCSCQFADPQAKIAAAMNPKRERSLAIWKGRQIQGHPALDFLPAATALVLPPILRSESRLSRQPGNTMRYDAKFTFKGAISAGSAVAITPDGYFLTAAHCVEELPRFTLIGLTEENKVAEVTGRVVWKGRGDDAGPDLAVIHAPFRPAAFLLPTPLERTKPGTPVLTAGFGSKGFPTLALGQSGGQIAAAGPIQSRPGDGRWQELFHTAPLAHGDSGGPLLGPDGLLLGVNSRVEGKLFFPLGLNRIWFYKGAACAPDPAWLHRLIQEDRRKMRQRNRTRFPS